MICCLLLFTPGTGATAGMFWRFLVAADPTVDRYYLIVMDSFLSYGYIALKIFAYYSDT